MGTDDARPAVVEFAICVTARFWESNVEWTAHARAAKQYGVSDGSLEAVLSHKRPEGGPADEGVTYDVCRAMHETHRLTDEQYKTAVATFGEQGLVEMMATTGYYTLVAMTLSAFEVQPAEGVARPFAR